MRRFLLRALALVCAIVGFAARADAENRVTWYYGEQADATKINQEARNLRLGLGTDRAAFMGNGGGYYNLAISPATGLYVSVGPGSTSGLGALYQLIADDTAALGGGPVNPSAQLPPDSTTIVGQALVAAASPSIGPLAVPSTVGYSQISLIECQVTTIDTTPITRNFIYLGQQTATVNDARIDEASCQAKAGTAGTSPSVPGADSGYIGIGYVTIPYGTATITTGMVSPLPPVTISLLPSALLSPASMAQATLPGSYLYTFPYGLAAPLGAANLATQFGLANISGTDASPYAENAIPNTPTASGDVGFAPIINANVNETGTAMALPFNGYVDFSGVNSGWRNSGAKATTTTAGFTLPSIGNSFTVAVASVPTAMNASVGVNFAWVIENPAKTLEAYTYITAISGSNVTAQVENIVAGSSGSTMPSGSTWGINSPAVGMFLGAQVENESPGQQAFAQNSLAYCNNPTALIDCSLEGYEMDLGNNDYDPGQWNSPRAHLEMVGFSVNNAYTYPIMASFQSSFQQATSTNSLTAGDRPHVGYAVRDAIDAGVYVGDHRYVNTISGGSMASTNILEMTHGIYLDRKRDAYNNGGIYYNFPSVDIDFDLAQNGVSGSSSDWQISGVPDAYPTTSSAFQVAFNTTPMFKMNSLGQLELYLCCGSAVPNFGTAAIAQNTSGNGDNEVDYYNLANIGTSTHCAHQWWANLSGSETSLGCVQRNGLWNIPTLALSGTTAISLPTSSNGISFANSGTIQNIQENGTGLTLGPLGTNTGPIDFFTQGESNSPTAVIDTSGDVVSAGSKPTCAGGVAPTAAPTSGAGTICTTASHLYFYTTTWNTVF